MRQSEFSQLFDVAIVGGGINGAVAAAALSAAGLKVVLLEKGDFASSTSQESSNLVWGGIKYLESYEFGLVWELCRSRNELMRRYPSSVTEIRFLTTLQQGFRKPRFMVFMGTLLYWFMGRFKTRAPRLLSRKAIVAEESIINTGNSQGGLEYSDCYLKDNDARFVFQFIRRAARAGAKVLNYAEVKQARQQADQLWELVYHDAVGQRDGSIRAKTFINAAGPYADRLNAETGIATRHRHIFSKGVHLIVPKLSSSERVLTFFADDGRLFFVIPMGARSCIGTTDTRVDSMPPQVSAEDRTFILSNINKRLSLPKPLSLDDVISERCGVRPLVIEGGNSSVDDWMHLSRKHAIEVHKERRQISIFGGKLTDCLNIGRELQQAMQGLGFKLERSVEWFGEGKGRELFQQQARVLGLGDIVDEGEGRLIDRLWRCYDQDAFSILAHIRDDPSLLEKVAGAIIFAEVKHIAEHEMVVSLGDFLRRRTRLALVLPRHELLASKNLKKASQILFGARAEEEWQAYFGGA